MNPAANSSKLAIGQERDATNHPGRESFDGELARLLIYDRPLTQVELGETMGTPEEGVCDSVGLGSLVATERVGSGVVLVRVWGDGSQETFMRHVSWLSLALLVFPAISMALVQVEKRLSPGCSPTEARLSKGRCLDSHRQGDVRLPGLVQRSRRWLWARLGTLMAVDDSSRAIARLTSGPIRAIWTRREVRHTVSARRWLGGLRIQFALPEDRAAAFPVDEGVRHRRGVRAAVRRLHHWL